MERGSEGEDFFLSNVQEVLPFRNLGTSMGDVASPLNPYNLLTCTTALGCTKRFLFRTVMVSPMG